MPAQRDHYYRFAHRVLPSLLHEDLAPFRAALVAGQLENLLRNVWREVAITAGATLETALEINAAVRNCAGRTVVLITPPTPMRVTEAYFIGVVLDHEDPAFLRYVVLELSRDTNGEPSTMLGEWVTAERRLNYGTGPRPTEAEFLEAVCTRFTQRPPRSQPESSRLDA